MAGGALSKSTRLPGRQQITKCFRGVFGVHVFFGFANFAAAQHEQIMVVIMVMIAVAQVGVGLRFQRDAMRDSCGARAGNKF